MFKQIITLFILIIISTSKANTQTIDSIIGPIEEKNNTIIEIINSKAMQRLTKIDQSGPEAYFIKNFPKFSRYEHSIGVYALLKKYNLPIEEQIAGLLHDSSHTVFSHLGDWVMQAKANRQKSYQDQIHSWHLTQMGVDKLIKNENLNVTDINPENPKFSALKQAFPDMNADRIEYNLHTGKEFLDLSEKDIQHILNNLHYTDNKWFFSDTSAAKKLGKLSMYYTRNLWGSPRNVATYAYGSALLNYAIDNKIISSSDLHFGDDLSLINKLEKSNDKLVIEFLVILNNIHDYYELTTKSKYDIHQKIKMRGFDPLVKLNNSMSRLSEISLDYKDELELTKKYANQGIYLNLIKVKNHKLKNYVIQFNS